MKFAVVFFLLLDIPYSKGQQKPEVFGHIVLKLSYPSFYNGYEKFCCKLYPGGCYKLVDNRGFVCDLLKGRVTNAQSDGWIEFKIWNAQLGDTGYYRCIVVGTQNHIYKDYYVEISEPSRRRSLPPSPLTTTPTPLTTTPTPLMTTIKPYKTSKTLPDATMASLAKDVSENSKVPWSFGLPLTVVVSIAVLMIITSVTAAVCYRVKAKNECEETLCESSQHRASEVSGIVYTTVDFTPHPVPTELYANLSVHSPRARAPDRNEEDHAGMVEYTTLAIRQ